MDHGSAIGTRRRLAVGVKDGSRTTDTWLGKKSDGVVFSATLRQHSGLLV